MLTLLIDNYDSFTYNLFQLLASVNGREPLVVRNDEASWDELARLEFDNVVISPGPGRPDRARDFGVCAEAIRRCERPLLGVCLGMQGLGWLEGGDVERAPQPLHGRVVEVEHDGSTLFAGIPSPFEAVRYHSLALTPPLPSSLREIATCDGVPMAVEHRDRPQWGVQFHPESIVTEHGARLLTNFCDLSSRGSFVRNNRTKEPRDVLPGPRGRTRGSFVRDRRTKEPPNDGTAVAARRLHLALDCEDAFVTLFGESEHAFWLDSSRPGERGRFSFMGDASGPNAEVLLHEAGEGEPLLDRLQHRLEELRPAKLPDLPFEFDCGFVGYLGYELKSECGYASPHPSEHPDAALIFSDRLIRLRSPRGSHLSPLPAQAG